MAVKIRLKRTGTTNKPCFRIVVTDIRKQRDGDTIETLGYYIPVRKETKFDMERAKYWLDRGAKMSKTVNDIYRRSSGNLKKGEPAPLADASSAPASISTQ